MSYIFTGGSCLKKDFYDLVINSMISAGWTNVTSKYATDGDVLHSTGVNGDKDIYLRFAPYSCLQWGAPSAVNDTNYSLRTTTNWGMSVQLQPSYAPGASGVAGVFGYPTREWKEFMMAMPINSIYYNSPTAVPADTVVNYYIYIDKSKIILFSKLPDNLSNTYHMNYVGLPDTLYSANDAGRGSVIANTCLGPGSMGNNKIAMCEFPEAGKGKTSGSTHYSVDCYSIQPNTLSPNVKGNYFFSEFYLHHAEVGMISKLDGIYGTISGNLNTGDTVTINGVQYLVMNCVKTGTYVYAHSTYYTPTYPIGYVASTGATVTSIAIRIS